MRDRVEIRFTVATDEVSGKAAKVIAGVLNKGLAKIEPQIMRLVEAGTTALEKYIAKDSEESEKLK